MRKFISILILALFVGQSINAQKKVPENLVPENSGQFFVFLNNKYQITVSDVVEISKGIEGMKENVAYNLKNGQVFFVYGPQEWQKLMKDILSEIDGSANNIADSLATGNIAPWDDNVSGTTTNYAVTKGKVWIVAKHYKGEKGVRALIYKGYPILKVGSPCLNPNRPDKIEKIIPVEIPKAPVVPVAPVIPVVPVKKVDDLPIPKDDELKIPIPKDEKKDQCCCEGKYSIEEIKKLFELFKEAQIKQEAPQQQGNWMVVTPQSDDSRYNWRAQQRDYYYEPEPRFFQRFFLSIGLNWNQGQQYIPILRTMSQGISGGNGNGNPGVGGIRRTMSGGLGG